MSGIPQLLYHQLLEVLLTCDELANGEHLRALFVTPELRPFQTGLPDANNSKQRADQLIDYLLDRQHANGENTLVLFVQLLSTRYNAQDERYQMLLTVLAQLRKAFNNTLPHQLTVETTPLHKIQRRFREYSTAILPITPPSIRNIQIPIPQIEQIEQLLQVGKPVLVTGRAGVGKSGIAYQLVRHIQQNKGVLLLDARRLGKLTQVQELRSKLDLDESVVDAIALVGQSGGCRLIIDQLDSVFETSCAELLCDLACSCSALPSVEIVVIARDADQTSAHLNQLIQHRFQPVSITPLSEASSRQLLVDLGISSLTDQLIELGTNLLHLDLISRIQAEAPTTNFAAIDDEVKLWHYYFETIEKNERMGSQLEQASQIVAEAMRLAWEGLNSPERTVTLPRLLTLVQRRLITWEILQLEHGLIYHFRHEKLHDYLAARDAVDRDLSPDALLALLDLHKTSSVVSWMDKLYVHADIRYRRRFIERYLSAENSLPFYTKIALLDRYLQINISGENSKIITQILEMIRTDQNLRKHFFGVVPHYSWAFQLWEHGFFDSPPLPFSDGQGRQFLRHWDVQRYLIAIAKHAPDVVIRHVTAISHDGWYTRWALEALCQIPPELAILLLPRILIWLEDPAIAQSIDHPVYRLMLRFAQAKLEDPALTLFGTLITPTLSSGKAPVDHWLYRPSVSPRIDYDELLDHELPLLQSVNLTKLLQILEGRLRIVAALLSENKVSSLYSSDWRSAIENTDQDDNDGFEDKLLVALRNSLEVFVENDSIGAEQLILRYLNDNYVIFRRLGLHLLAHFPGRFPGLVANQLLVREHLEDGEIHHEFFMVLRNGFSRLQPKEQMQLIALIQAGFLPEKEQRYRQWLSVDNVADPEYEIENLRQRWIRDRIWMIREHLPDEAAQQLKVLIATLGAPSHPDFLSWSGPSEWGAVQEISPLSKAQIAEMSPDVLASYLAKWSPPTSGHIFRQESYAGLAGTVARVVCTDLFRYAEHIRKVIWLHPVFAQAIMGHLANKDNVRSLPWPFCLELIELLLSEPPARQIDTQIIDVNSTTVRRAIIDVLERGLDDATVLPTTFYPQVQAILFKLLDDSDPDSESDNPPENYLGHNDPLQIALNHIRPLAVDLIIQYQVTQYCQEDEIERSSTSAVTLPCRTLTPAVATILTTSLNPAIEPSWSVRAVFGRRLLTLYWLDEEWTKVHLSEILPEAEDSQSARFFLAAWDTFVVSYSYCTEPELLEMLRPKYALAINKLAHGLVTRSLNPIQGLARHLVVEYLQGNYAIDTIISEHNLLGKFLATANADARAQAAWAAWRFCANHPQQFWPKVKQLWAWRLQIATTANNPSDYKREISYYAQLAVAIHTLESMVSMRDLLTDTLLYITGSNYDYGAREAFEAFLVQKVEQEPLDVIKFYQLMRDRESDPYRFKPNEIRRKILAIGAEHEASRQATLSLIDDIARLGEHGYKDIYTRYA